MSSGVVAIDGAGTLRVLNAGAAQLLGCTPEQALGRRCDEVLVDQPGVVRLLLDALERKTPVSRGELSLEGGSRTIGLTVGPVFDDAGAPCGAGMIFRDLAPIERQDERARLRDRLAALGEMAAGLAHAIRNPLAGMEVSAGLLGRRLPVGSEARELLDDLLTEVRAVSRTVSEALEYVRPAVPQLERLDAIRLLEEAWQTARTRVVFGGSIERAWRGQALPLEGDPEQLRTALTDLIVNALQALDGRGRLRLGVCSEAGEGRPGPPDVVWSVDDDGPGVAPELREKIFHPFFSAREGGSGVGLANAQKVAAAHGGRVELECPARGGSVFRMRVAGLGGASA